MVSPPPDRCSPARAQPRVVVRRRRRVRVEQVDVGRVPVRRRQLRTDRHQHHRSEAAVEAERARASRGSSASASGGLPWPSPRMPGPGRVLGAGICSSWAPSHGSSCGSSVIVGAGADLDQVAAAHPALVVLVHRRRVARAAAHERERVRVLHVLAAGRVVRGTSCRRCSVAADGAAAAHGRLVRHAEVVSDLLRVADDLVERVARVDRDPVGRSFVAPGPAVRARRDACRRPRSSG